MTGLRGCERTRLRAGGGTKSEGIRRGETLRESVFILLKGEKILDTNYSCAYATHERAPFVPEIEKMNTEQE